MDGRDFAESWNGVMDSILELKGKWKKHREMALSHPDTSGLSIQGQRVLTMAINRSEFNQMLEWLPGHSRRVGGLGELVLPISDLRLVTKERKVPNEAT